MNWNVTSRVGIDSTTQRRLTQFSRNARSDGVVAPAPAGERNPQPLTHTSCTPG